MVDEADHVEAVGHDYRLGKVLADDRAKDRSQIHTDHANLLFAF
jgi:hypothetical protein